MNKYLIIEKGLNDAQVAREKSLKKRGWSNESPNQESKTFKLKIPESNQTVNESKTQSQETINIIDVKGPILGKIARGLKVSVTYVDEKAIK